MTKFFYKLIFCICLVGTVFAFVLIVPTASQTSLASMVNKRKMLEGYKNKKKIILLGGSSTLVGLSPREIFKATGIPVLNMALFAGFGLEFQTAFILPYLEKDDMVVFSPEYGVLLTHIETTPIARAWCLFASPAYALANLYSFPKDVSNLCIDATKIAQSKVLAILNALVNHKPGDTFFSKGFLHYSSFNDSLGGADPNIFEKLPDTLLSGYHIQLKDFSIKRNSMLINRLADELENRGVHAAFLWAPFPREELEFIRDSVTASRNLLSLKIIGDPDEFAYEYKYFSNTVNHLTKEGQKRRTGQFIQWLKNDYTYRTTIE